MPETVNKYHLKHEQILEEENLINAAKEDIKNFSILYNRSYERIFRYIYQRVDSEAVAADICSQVFLNAMQKIKDYENRGVPFVSWLYIIARNELNQAFRAKKVGRVVHAKTEDLANIVDEVEEGTYNDRQIEKLVSALNNMSHSDLELIEMRYFEHRPYAEISEIVGVPINNLKVKVSRIVKKLRKQFF